MRDQRKGLFRYIATVETSKHRFFTFLEKEILPDNKLIAIATDDAYILGILSSSIHVCWSLATGSWLGVGNDSVYVKSRCFEPFPFPTLDESPLKQRIRDLGERLDAYRKTQQALHPDLTLTGIYNVLEAVRAGTPLTAKEKGIHDKGLVSILQQIHDDLDAAVLEAYGWSDLAASKEAPHSCGAGECAAIEKREALPNDVSFTPPQKCGGSIKEALEQELLTRLVALNHARAAEEKNGLIRWLRPDYQNPAGQAAASEKSPSLPGTETTKIAASKTTTAALPWPAGLAAQVAAIQKLLPGIGSDAEALSACFAKKAPKRAQQIEEILGMLKGLGKL